MNKAIFNVFNTNCSGCKTSIEVALKKIGGLSNIEVDTDQGEISFNYLGADNLTKAIRKLHQMGYPTTGSKNSYGSKMKSLYSCAIGRTKNLKHST